LVQFIGADLSLLAIISAMLGSERGWKAFLEFSGKVMFQKKDEERKRRREEGERGVSRGEGRHLWRGRPLVHTGP